GREIRLVGADIRAGRTEPDGAHAVSGQQLADRLPDSGIVVHDENDVIVPCHHAGSVSIGRVKTNVAPRGSPFSAHSRPPWDSMIDWQIASPMPIPCSFVVKNGSNILSGNAIP